MSAKAAKVTDSARTRTTSVCCFAGAIDAGANRRSVRAESVRDARLKADDEQLLHEAGYKQELDRRMRAFSNFAISMSTICILAGGLTSFHVGLCSVGGASIGVCWALGRVFLLIRGVAV